LVPIRQHIKNVLVEENQNKKVNLVKQMIYDLFDEVSFIEQSTYNDKPLLKVYIDSDSNAANITSWFDRHIQDEIMEMTNGNVVVCPYWEFDWRNYRKENIDAYINTELLKYDNLGNVINESEEKKTLKNPIKYFYQNFIKGEPIEYKGIILKPTYHEEYDEITWEIENPEDYSFNGELIKNLVIEEFRDFCSLTGLDFYGLYQKINIISNMPKYNCHLNKKDIDFIETTLKNKKYIEFEADEAEFMLNLKYEKFDIRIDSATIEINTFYDFKGTKIKDNTEYSLNNRFIQNMSDYEYDDFTEWLYDGFYFEILLFLRSNPRFYENRIDMFDLSLQPTKY
jgi:hypothetical protein